jgi:thiol-disulfide isomerase/thioredoxin
MFSAQKENCCSNSDMSKKTFNATVLKNCLLLLCLLALATKAQAAITGSADTVIKQNDNLAIGKPLPNLSLQTADGATVNLVALKGKVILVDFWASWCMPCRASIPHLKALYQQYSDKGFDILSVSIDQNNKAWKTAMLKEAMPWLQAIDKYENGKDASVLMNVLGIQSVPFVIILGKDGRVMLINPDGTQIETALTKQFNP